jgi:hypothetical protein
MNMCCGVVCCCGCVQVKDAMVGKDKVVTVKPGAPMSEAAQLMVHNDVSVHGSMVATTSVGTWNECGAGAFVRPCQCVAPLCGCKTAAGRAYAWLVE